MKFIWVMLIFMMAFNGMAIFTNSLGVFAQTDITPRFNETELGNYSNLSKREEGIGSAGILGFDFGEDWLGNLGAILIGVATMGGAIGIAYWTRSPVPLGVGAFLAFTVGLWAHTFLVLHEFGINQIFLTVGMAGMAVMFVATTIEMITGGHNA